MNRRYVFIPRWKTSAEITIGNTGTGILNWNGDAIEYSRRADGWLTLAPGSGALAAGGAETVTLTIDRAGLRKGIHRAKVQLESNGGREDVTVFMTVPLLGGR